jgi:hypothetical protein
MMAASAGRVSGVWDGGVHRCNDEGSAHRGGCPLVRLAGGELALLESDGSLAPAERGIQAATSYMEVART